MLRNSARLLEQLVHRTISADLREGHIFVASLEWIVVPHGGPIDTHRRIDRRLDIFSPYFARSRGAGTRPAKIRNGSTRIRGPYCVGGADHTAALHASPRHHRGLNYVVVATQIVCRH